MSQQELNKVNEIRMEQYAIRVQDAESDRQSRPTMKDVVSTRNLLRQFGIDAVIPEFDKTSDLLRWRSGMIRRRLDAYD